MEITGTISGAQRVSLPSGGFVLRGVFYGDKRGRVSDGQYIWTSKAIEEVKPNLFRTESGSLYEVVSWFPPSKATADYETIPADWPKPL